MGKSRSGLFVLLAGVLALVFPLFGAQTVQADDPVPGPHVAAASATVAVSAAPSVSASGGAATPSPSPKQAGREAASELDPYSQRWHDAAKRCERFVVDPVVRMMQGAPSNAPAEDVGEHAGIFLKTAAGLRARPRGAVEFMVATVPDPLQSGMFHSTDRVIEALQRAVEAPGPPTSHTRWLRDRYWSPWTDDPTLSDEVEKKLMSECRRRMPAVLTFRDDATFGLPSTDGRPQALIILLVGESPILGINKFAMREALDFISLSSRQLDEVKILGPTYSGSASSLWLALSSWKVPPFPPSPSAVKPAAAKTKEATVEVRPCFTIVSGTVTREVTKERLSTCREHVGGISCVAACASEKAPTKATFHTATIPDGERLRAFYTFLQDDLGVPADHGAAGCRLPTVALIKETSTAYSLLPPSDAGAPPQEAPRGDSGAPAHRMPEAGGEPQPTIDDGKVEYSSTADGIGCVPVLEMSFPPHISNVRRAYDAQRKASARGTSASDVGLLPALTPSLDEPGEPRDIFPNLSARTVFSNDLVVDNIIDTLAHHDIRYVGLFATDRSDIIFLASQLHHNASDMRLFTFSSELLYAHPAYQAALNGMLVTSTYPLTVDHDIVGGRVDLFSGEQEEGVFNATAALLDKPSAMRDYGQTKDGLPSVHISVIGRGGAFPLKTVDDFKDKRATMVHGGAGATAGAQAGPQPVPHLWRIAFFVTSVLLLYVALVHGYARGLFISRRYEAWWKRRPTAAKTPAMPVAGATVPPPTEMPPSLSIERDKLHIVPAFPPLASLFYPCLHPRLSLRKDAVTTALFAFMLAAYTPLSALHTAATGSELGTAITCVLVVSLVASVVQLLFHFWRDRWSDGIDRFDWGMDIAIVVAAFVVSSFAFFIAWHVGTHMPASCDASPFCRRAVALDSGVSPITPLVFAVAIVLLWTVGTIDRLRMADGLLIIDRSKTARPPTLPVSRVLAIGKDDKDAPQDIATLEGRLRDAVMAPSRTLGIRLVLLPLAAFPAFALLRVKPFSTLEVHRPESVFSANTLAGLTVALCTFLLADTIVSIVLVFIRLRSFLRRLARHSLADAYGRLPGGIARSLEQQLSGQVPDLTELAVPVLQLRILKNHDTELANDAADAMDAFKRERQALAETQGYAVLGASETVAKLMAAAAIVIGRSREAWNARVPMDVITLAAEKPEAAAANEAEGEGEGEPSLSPPPPSPLKSKSKAEQAAQVLRENFIASLVTMFLHQYVRTFRPMMTTAVGGSMLLLLLISSYVFEPRHLIMGFLWLLILSAAACCGYVFIELDKDELLSRIAKSTPGHVTFDRAFVLRIATWAALPVLSIVAVQYPAVSDTLLSWVKPLLRGLQR